MSITLVYDATHANVSHLPPGQAAGYTTGSPGIKWSPSDWAAHPGAVRICQDITASDITADILDVESGAATNAISGKWYQSALASFSKGARPGQRHPALYTSAANVTPLVNALITAGVNAGPGLWVANWNLSDAQATAEVIAASGPYPIIGVQYASGEYYDSSCFASAWLNTVSHAPSQGPYRHLADGHRSLAAIAADRGTTAAHLWATTAAAYTETDVHTASGLVLPHGWPYYTTNP